MEIEKQPQHQKLKKLMPQHKRMLNWTQADPSDSSPHS